MIVLGHVIIVRMVLQDWCVDPLQVGESFVNSCVTNDSVMTPRDTRKSCWIWCSPAQISLATQIEQTIPIP
jgi:hypothetical protein